MVRRVFLIVALVLCSFVAVQAIESTESSLAIENVMDLGNEVTEALADTEPEHQLTLEHAPEINEQELEAEVESEMGSDVSLVETESEAEAESSVEVDVAGKPKKAKKAAKKSAKKGKKAAKKGKKAAKKGKKASKKSKKAKKAKAKKAKKAKAKKAKAKKAKAKKAAKKAAAKKQAATKAATPAATAATPAATPAATSAVTTVQAAAPTTAAAVSAATTAANTAVAQAQAALAKLHPHHKSPKSVLKKILARITDGSDNPLTPYGRKGHRGPFHDKVEYYRGKSTKKNADKLAEALTAVKEEIMVRSKELRAEKEWTVQVESLMTDYQKKVQKVNLNVEALKTQVKDLLKKKKQIQNAQIQEKLVDKLKTAKADLLKLKKQMDHIKNKEDEFSSTETQLKKTMDTLKGHLTKLKGEKPTVTV